MSVNQINIIEKKQLLRWIKAAFNQTDDLRSIVCKQKKRCARESVSTAYLEATVSLSYTIIKIIHVLTSLLKELSVIALRSNDILFEAEDLILNMRKTKMEMDHWNKKVQMYIEPKYEKLLEKNKQTET